jgi:hypothetical protein
MAGETYDAKIIDLWNLKKSDPEIAEIIGMSRAFVWNRRKALGLSGHNIRGARHYKKNICAFQTLVRSSIKLESTYFDEMLGHEVKRYSPAFAQGVGLPFLGMGMVDKL